MYTLQHDTPAGPLTTIARGDHTVLAAGFTTDSDQLSGRLGQPTPAQGGVGGPVDLAVRAYLDGALDALDHLRLDQPGTAFQHLVWTGLRAVPAGTTASYQQLATAVGRPGATRAVGSACGRNLIAPFVPCHRAVRTDGTLGGYYYGLDVKGWLLRHETRQG